MTGMDPAVPASGSPRSRPVVWKAVDLLGALLVARFCFTSTWLGPSRSIGLFGDMVGELFVRAFLALTIFIVVAVASEHLLTRPLARRAGKSRKAALWLLAVYGILAYASGFYLP
jgi:hypothetical protein